MKTAKLVRALLGLCVFAVAPTAFATTLCFDDAPFPEGSRGTHHYKQEDFHLTGDFSHTGGSNSGRPANGSGGFMSVLNDGHVQVIRSTSPFYPFYEIDTSTGEPIPVEPRQASF